MNQKQNFASKISVLNTKALTLQHFAIHLAKTKDRYFKFQFVLCD